MSGPRSLRAAFEACQPLRKSSPLLHRQTCYRSFHLSRSSLLDQPPLSPSEAPQEHGIDNHPLLERPSEPLASTAAKDPSSPSQQSTSKTPEVRPLRLPRAVQASYLRPLRHPPTYGHTVCSLQLRSYSVRNLEFMADFAMRVAYYLGLPAKGPRPLPKIVQRWTLLKSPFVNKTAQENFERITLKRVVDIQDGDVDVVKIWLAYLRRYAFWGVGMKANVWEFEGLDVGGNMDKAYKDIEKDLEEKLSSFGFRDYVAGSTFVLNGLKSRNRGLPGMPMQESRFGSLKKRPHETESIY